MKKLCSLLLPLALVVCTSSAYGQKFATINSQELMALMPELDSVQIKLQALNKELYAQLEIIQVEFNQKYEDYQAKSATLSDAVRQLKEKELQDIQSRFQNYQTLAQQDMTKTEQQLMAPVVKRATDAINKVSKANGYAVVFDSSAGATVYTDPAHVTDILPLVKKELGIAADAKPRGATPTAAPAQK